MHPFIAHAAADERTAEARRAAARHRHRPVRRPRLVRRLRGDR